MSALEARLGYATNAELIAELTARWEMGSVDPGYSTMGGTPKPPQPVIEDCRCGKIRLAAGTEVGLDVMVHSVESCRTVPVGGHIRRPG
jgi:hypothetical protein